MEICSGVAAVMRRNLAKLKEIRVTCPPKLTLLNEGMTVQYRSMGIIAEISMISNRIKTSRSVKARGVSSSLDGFGLCRWRAFGAPNARSAWTKKARESQPFQKASTWSNCMRRFHSSQQGVQCISKCLNWWPPVTGRPMRGFDRFRSLPLANLEAPLAWKAWQMFKIELWTLRWTIWWYLLLHKLRRSWTELK